MPRANLYEREARWDIIVHDTPSDRLSRWSCSYYSLVLSASKLKCQTQAQTPEHDHICYEIVRTILHMLLTRINPDTLSTVWDNPSPRLQEIWTWAPYFAEERNTIVVHTDQTTLWQNPFSPVLLARVWFGYSSSRFNTNQEKRLWIKYSRAASE